MDISNHVIELLREILQLPDNRKLDESSGLLGELPEFDSMAVVSVLTAIEDEFDIVISDDDVTASAFEDVESLTGFVEAMLRDSE